MMTHWRNTVRAVLAGALAMAALAHGGPARAASATLVVNEVMAGDGHAATHEYVEIRNISNEDLHVDLYELRYQSTSSLTGLPGSSVTTFHTFPVGTIIPAGGYYLVVSDLYAAHDAHKDVRHNAVYSAPLGLLGLHGGVGIFDAAGNRVDSVGWGMSTPEHPMVETTAISTFMSNGTVIERVEGANGMSQDTDDNSMDFEVALEPSPTSTPYTPNVPVVSVNVNPHRLEPGATAQVTVTATPTANPVQGVTMDLTALGGSATAPLSHGAGNVWTGQFQVPAGQAAGPLVLIARADDTNGKYGTGGASLFIYPGPPISVAAAKALTPNTGDLVRVRGVVMATSTGPAYITDAGVNGGLAVVDGNLRDGIAPLQVGQDVTITGRIVREEWVSSADPNVLTYRSELRLETATGTADDTVVNASGLPVPAPKTVTLFELATDPALVGQMVQVSGVSAEKTPAKVAGSTGDNNPLMPINGMASTWVGISRSATDKAMTPYPGLPTLPIPATLDSNFYVPWIATNDTFDVRGVVGITSTGINTKTGLISPQVLRVRDAADFRLTNNAKFIAAAVAPSPAERGRSARFRVVGYPVETAAVTLNLAAIGLGTVTLPNDGQGGYAADIVIPASAALGAVSAPVSVSANGQTATGSLSFTVAAPTINPGDVDRSGGAANMADVALALRVSGGLTNGGAASVSVPNGDVFPKGSPDGRLTLEDALRILRGVMGLETL